MIGSITREKRKKKSRYILNCAIGACFTLVVELVVWGVQFHFENFSTQSSIIKTLSRYFDSVDTETSYEDALVTIYKETQTKDQTIVELTEANNRFAETIDELEKTITQLQSDYDSLLSQYNSDENIHSIISNAKAYAEEEEYALALAVLNDTIIVNDELVLLKTEYQSYYERQIASEVSSLLNQEKYNDATLIVTTALSLLPDSSTLKELQEKIEDATPRKLLDALSPFEKAFYSEDPFDMAGVTYRDGFSLIGDNSMFSKEQYAIFNLDGKYTLITGIIGHVDGSQMMDIDVDIILDGKKYDTYTVTARSLPQPFEINVQNVKQIIIDTHCFEVEIGFAELKIK